MNRSILFLYSLFICLHSFAQPDTLKCEVYGSSTNPIEWSNTAWYINGEMQEYSFCGNPIFLPSIHVAIVDKDSCKAWATCNYFPNNFFFNQVNDCGVCRARPERYYIFRLNDPNSMAYLDSLLTNSVLNGHQLLMYSGNCTDFSYLNSTYPNTIQIFQNLGFIAISSITDKLPFIFYTEIGSPSTAIEVYGQDSTSYISLTQLIQNCGGTLNITEENNIKSKIYPTIIQNGEVLNVEYDVLNLYDISGKQILSLSNSGNKLLIEKMKTGMYFIHVKKGTQERIEKIMITE